MYKGMDMVFVSPEIYPIKGSFIKNLQTRLFMIFVRGYLFLIFFVVVGVVTKAHACMLL